jgi:hypothetical protein
MTLESASRPESGLSVPRTFDGMRSVLFDYLRNYDPGGRMWDLLTGLRGPDSPSERPDLSDEVNRTNYAARRARKRQTVEVIRGHAFPGIGGARYRTDVSQVVLPQPNKWDHFDKHVARAAKALNLSIVYEKEPLDGKGAE